MNNSSLVLAANFAKILAIYYISFISFGLFSQSINGNVNMSNSRNLSYANVDIYKGDKLVASVLTDVNGNYSIKLDTGIYRVEYQYAGFEKIVEEVKVDRDIELTQKMKENKSDKFYKPMEERERIAKDASEKRATRSPAPMMSYGYASDAVGEGSGSGGSYEYTPGVTMSRGGYGSESVVSPYTRDRFMASSSINPVKSDKEIKAGQLTAGEINDFAKWKMWNDLTASDLYKYQLNWKISPNNRYSVQVRDQRRQPLVNAEILLKNEQGDVIYKSRTDNTGKAELWGDLRLTESGSGQKYSIVATHAGKSKTLKKAQPFSKGVNMVEFDSPCNLNYEVDIAFVVDATGSMSDELNFLKAELNDVIFQTKQIDQRLSFRFGNVFYRDHGDEYLTRSLNFTRVLSEAITFISDQRAGGGGDYEEAVEVALDSAINHLSWNEEARARLIFLILDAPPHNTPAIQEKLMQLMKQAADKGIRIIPLVASGINKEGEYLMRTMALATNGTYAFLTNHSGIGNSKIAPSTDNYEVELLNDLLIRIIRNYSFIPDCEDEFPDLEIDLPDSIVVVENPNLENDSISHPTNQQPNITWKYWPNPTNGIVNIEVDKDVEELFITDMNGKILERLTNITAHRAVQADLSAYATGIYLIRYPVGKQWISGKLVLVRT
jgi:hypothetical protein